MILRFDLSKCITEYNNGRLDSKFINPAGEKHFTAWAKFAFELLKIKGNTPTRIDFSYIDRTMAMPSIVKTHIPPEQLIPTGLPKHTDYFDICLSRARELLATNKQLNVMWSGGLDSSLILFSLMREAQNLDQINVLCTFESILESGKMFDRFIKDSGVRVKFEDTRFECNFPFSFDNEDTSQLYIHGNCADQLFGPTVNFPMSKIQLSDPWYYGQSRNFLDVLEPSIKLSERPIETVRDLRWWLFFNHAWTTVLLDATIERPAHLCPRIQSFYATPEFQRWAITTPSYYENNGQYRWPAKQALSKLIDYQYYIDHKKKGLSATWWNSNKWYMMDQNYQNYYISK